MSGKCARAGGRDARQLLAGREPALGGGKTDLPPPAGAGAAAAQQRRKATIYGLSKLAQIFQILRCTPWSCRRQKEINV
jgi:hypothetical protein